MKKRRISDAYEAWWFLYYHPKLRCRRRAEVKPEEADRLEAEGFIVTRDQRAEVPPGEEGKWWDRQLRKDADGKTYAGGKCWREYRHLSHLAVRENLEIHYAKVSTPGGHGRVDIKDRANNKYVECWLEFGQMKHGYAYSGREKPSADYDVETMLHGWHDPDLDSGGPTFDDALVMLAKKVLKKFGDYKEERESARCPKDCADCRDIGVVKRPRKK